MFCKNLNKRNLKQYLAFIFNSDIEFRWETFIYYLIDALKIGKEADWSVEKWISVLRWFDFEKLSYHEFEVDGKKFDVEFDVEGKVELIKILFEYLKPSEEECNEIFEIVGVELISVNE